MELEKTGFPSKGRAEQTVVGEIRKNDRNNRSSRNSDPHFCGFQVIKSEWPWRRSVLTAKSLAILSDGAHLPNIEHTTD